MFSFLNPFKLLFYANGRSKVSYYLHSRRKRGTQMQFLWQGIIVWNITLSICIRIPSEVQNVNSVTKGFGTKLTCLITYVKKVHEKSSSVIECGTCGQNFKDSIKLRLQVKESQVAVLVFKCKLCRKTMQSYRHLVRHKLDVHEQEKPHECHHCKKAFARFGDVQSLKPQECWCAHT